MTNSASTLGSPPIINKIKSGPNSSLIKSRDHFSNKYDQKVYSVTACREKRQIILNNIQKGTVLNMGCGPTPYLNIDLVYKGNKVIASDFNSKIIHKAYDAFTHSSLQYLIADNCRLGLKNNYLDSVISINSILPPSRSEVLQMLKEIYRVLQIDGKFVGIMAAFDTANDIQQNYLSELKLDHKDLRVYDTSGWQSFHTEESLKSELKIAGFNSFQIKKIFINDEEELSQINKVYGTNFPKGRIFGLMVVAVK